MKKYLITGGLIVAIVVALFGLRSCQKKRDTAIANPNLSPDVKEKIIINPLKRTIIIATKNGTTVTTLPDRPTSIELLNDGKVRVRAPQWGFEAIPFIGIGYSRQVNDYVGLDFFYWKKLDAGLAFSFDRLKVDSLGLPLTLSYTVWHNLRLTVGYEMIGSRKDIHGLVSVRI